MRGDEGAQDERGNEQLHDEGAQQGVEGDESVYDADYVVRDDKEAEDKFLDYK